MIVNLLASASLALALWFASKGWRDLVWDALADACLTDGRGGSVLDGMWLTDGDPWWGYNDDPSGNGKWVTGRGEPPRHIAFRP